MPSRWCRPCTRNFPHLTYDVTIKIEHLLRYAEHLPTLRETGCVLITSAVEAVQDHILHLLDKGHTRQDFFDALALCQQVGLNLNPTFVAFTPWTTLDDYIELLTVLAYSGPHRACGSHPVGDAPPAACWLDPVSIAGDAPVSPGL